MPKHSACESDHKSVVVLGPPEELEAAFRNTEVFFTSRTPDGNTLVTSFGKLSRKNLIATMRKMGLLPIREDHANNTYREIEAD